MPAAGGEAKSLHKLMFRERPAPAVGVPYDDAPVMPLEHADRALAACPDLTNLDHWLHFPIVPPRTRPTIPPGVSRS